MNNKPTYISKDGLEKLRHELEEMVSIRRPEIAQRIHDAKEHGDLTENAEYEDAKNEQAFVEGRIQTLEALIKNATLIDEHHSNDHVQIGSTVKVSGPDGSQTFTIVGSTEAKPTEGRISNESPVGRALLGRKKGETSPSRCPRASSPTRSSRSHRVGRPMEWADELAARVSGPQVVNDSKTPSGTVHVGSLRGPVILDVITRALRAAGHETTLLYGIDDLDPMDAQALLTPDAVEREMGRPARAHPGPGGRRARLVRPAPRAAVHRHVRRARRPPGSLLLDERALRRGRHGPVHPDRARQGGDRPRGLSARRQRPAPGHVAPGLRDLPDVRPRRDDDRHEWDGDEVFFECRASLVTWARGCGDDPAGSRRSAGAAKLPWNLEWAAQWSLFGVTIEPNGKDLATAGGSRDRSEAIAREVFEREPPINVPYEFLNIGGKKMSTSKGVGASATRMTEVVPPEQLRFLFLRPRPNQAIEFDPEGTDAIPRLFDEFDRLGDAVAGRDVKGELPQGFEQRLPLLAARSRTRISTPRRRSLPVSRSRTSRRSSRSRASTSPAWPRGEKGERARARGAGRPRDADRLRARAWLDVYAPDDAKIAVQPTLPVGRRRARSARAALPRARSSSERTS